MLGEMPYISTTLHQIHCSVWGQVYCKFQGQVVGVRVGMNLNIWRTYYMQMTFGYIRPVAQNLDLCFDTYENGMLTCLNTDFSDLVSVAQGVL